MFIHWILDTDLIITCILVVKGDTVCSRSLCWIVAIVNFETFHEWNYNFVESHTMIWTWNHRVHFWVLYNESCTSVDVFVYVFQIRDELWIVHCVHIFLVSEIYIYIYFYCMYQCMFTSFLTHFLVFKKTFLHISSSIQSHIKTYHIAFPPCSASFLVWKSPRDSLFTVTQVSFYLKTAIPSGLTQKGEVL